MKTYTAARLIQAVNCGLKERPLPFPDAPLPFTPRCGNHGWAFTQRLLAEPYCADGQTILPVDKHEKDTPIVRLRVTEFPDGTLTFEQIADRAADYDDLLLGELAAMQPGMHRCTLVLATQTWDTKPEDAFMPEYLLPEEVTVECEHEIATTFGFALDGDAKTAELTEDAAALEMFRAALIEYEDRPKKE